MDNGSGKKKKRNANNLPVSIAYKKKNENKVFMLTVISFDYLCFKKFHIFPFMKEESIKPCLLSR